MKLTVFAVLLLAGCASSRPFPERPDVAFYHHPTPLLIPQAPVQRPGMRPLTPPPVEAPICVSESDHTALSLYFDRIDAWRHKAGK